MSSSSELYLSIMEDLGIDNPDESDIKLIEAIAQQRMAQAESYWYGQKEEYMEEYIS